MVMTKKYKELRRDPRSGKNKTKNLDELLFLQIFRGWRKFNKISNFCPVCRDQVDEKLSFLYDIHFNSEKGKRLL